MSVGHKRESFDNIIKRLLKKWHENSEKYEKKN